MFRKSGRLVTAPNIPQVLSTKSLCMEKGPDDVVCERIKGHDGPHYGMLMCGYAEKDLFMMMGLLPVRWEGLDEQGKKSA
jgi:hypothetical protein